MILKEDLIGAIVLTLFIAVANTYMQVHWVFIFMVSFTSMSLLMVLNQRSRNKDVEPQDR